MRFSKDLVSVIVPNWNYKISLIRCLNSLHEQTYDSFEIIVVDNGSTDGSIEVVEQNYLDVNLINLGENRRFSASINEGIRHSHGSLIAILNNDTIVDKNWLYYLVDALERRPEVGICTPKIMQYPEKDRIYSVGDTFTRTGSAYRMGYGERDDGRFDTEKYVFAGCGASMIFRRSLLDCIGLFDEHFVEQFEDIDFCFRSQLGGFKCLYVPTSVVYHEGAAGLKMNPDRWNYVCFVGVRNKIFLIIKCLPVSLLFKYLPWIIFANVLANTWHIMTGRFLIVLKAHWSLLQCLPHMLRKRKHILKYMKVSTTYVDSIVSREDPRFKEAIEKLKNCRLTSAFTV